MNTLNRGALVNSTGQQLYQLKELQPRSTAVGGQRRHILASPAVVNNLMGNNEMVLAVGAPL